MEDFEVTQHIFEKLIEEKTIRPALSSRIARRNWCRWRSRIPGRFAWSTSIELCINGQEISPGYSELNDPIVQRDAASNTRPAAKRQKLDEDFLLALEHGMPPAGRIGIGIDRLVMMLTGAESIRDVILFPHAREKRNE